jgi:integrase
VAALSVSDIDLEQNLLIFFRQKVSKIQKHRLTSSTRMAIDRCFAFGDVIAGSSTPLLRRSLKNKNLSEYGISERGITHRVMVLGKQVGLSGLSAHDCRHYWATIAAKNGTDPFSLQEAGGWSSLAMPRRYIDDNAIANEGVHLNKDR